MCNQDTDCHFYPPSCSLPCPLQVSNPRSIVLSTVRAQLVMLQGVWFYQIAAILFKGTLPSVTLSAMKSTCSLLHCSLLETGLEQGTEVWGRKPNVVYERNAGCNDPYPAPVLWPGDLVSRVLKEPGQSVLGIHCTGCAWSLKAPQLSQLMAHVGE